MRIIELEAKSKGKRRAASFFIVRWVWRLSITYCLLVMSERACPQTQCKHKATARPTNPFSQSSCIHVLAEGGSLTLLQRFVADIATRHYHTSQLTPQALKKLTPQANQEPGQYRSSHNWYSKLIKLEHEHRLLKFWTEFCALHYWDLLTSKSKKFGSIVSQKKLGHGGMAPCNRQHI